MVSVYTSIKLNNNHSLGLSRSFGVVRKVNNMEVTNNTKLKQFEIEMDGHKAELVYRLRKKTLFLMHTYVPEELRGNGLASKLASTALEYAKEKDYKIAVLCPFVGAYVKKHPEWYALFDREYHQNLPTRFV